MLKQPYELALSPFHGGKHLDLTSSPKGPFPLPFLSQLIIALRSPQAFSPVLGTAASHHLHGSLMGARSGAFADVGWDDIMSVGAWTKPGQLVASVWSAPAAKADLCGPLRHHQG